ncbi:uncharacterized protein ColSpa_07162 [Colletotrichum spaethianum]|uniref:Uncharacterized protein n=1 Tax=Colletotrichum spaethianum TaxID=700344 RepID=A0AA37LER7_9PEZI|nr:uncharacterized protein ColSpa_07162 [Colletotrichum spaethianum]GKT46981.1 hypothetical protein ColSpa_07162 [Colletotrichum spaethianum]
MAPTQNNASKASKVKTPQAGIQKPSRGAQNKKSGPRTTRKTATESSVPAVTPSNASDLQEGEGRWVWTENPPTKDQTALNGRQKGRSLVQWNRK